MHKITEFINTIADYSGRPANDIRRELEIVVQKSFCYIRPGIYSKFYYNNTINYEKVMSLICDEREKETPLLDFCLQQKLDAIYEEDSKFVKHILEYMEWYFVGTERNNNPNLCEQQILFERELKINEIGPKIFDSNKKLFTPLNPTQFEVFKFYVYSIFLVIEGVADIIKTKPYKESSKIVDMIEWIQTNYDRLKIELENWDNPNQETALKQLELINNTKGN